MTERLTESQKRLQLESNRRLNEAVRTFRERAGFTEDEELTPEKIKYKRYILENVAMLKWYSFKEMEEAILSNKYLPEE